MACGSLAWRFSPIEKAGKRASTACCVWAIDRPNCLARFSIACPPCAFCRMSYRLTIGVASLCGRGYAPAPAGSIHLLRAPSARLLFLLGGLDGTHRLRIERNAHLVAPFQRLRLDAAPGVDEVHAGEEAALLLGGE